jgi:hypothetical protein
MENSPPEFVGFFNLMLSVELAALSQLHVHIRLKTSKTRAASLRNPCEFSFLVSDRRKLAANYINRFEKSRAAAATLMVLCD